MTKAKPEHQGAGLLDAAQKAAKKGPPPVHLWNPPYCGEMDMRIARDGTWFHEGTPIGREAMVRLFASILKLEEGRFYLVTPVEKLGIQVEDAPFLAVDFRVENPGPDQVVLFTTNVGDEVALGAEHPLRMSTDETRAPYIMVRRGLEARVDRKSFYRLVEAGETSGTGDKAMFGIRSAGVFFALMSVREMAG